MTTIVIDNTARATAAMLAVQAHARVMNAESEPLEYQLVDLMTDLMHLCVDENLSITECVTRCLQHFDAETEEESDDQLPSIDLGQLSVESLLGKEGFLVSWKIDIEDADSAVEAARQARAMQSENSTAVCFEVLDKNTQQRIEVDLLNHTLSVD